jgi:hypothetical protein
MLYTQSLASKLGLSPSNIDFKLLLKEIPFKNPKDLSTVHRVILDGEDVGSVTEEQSGNCSIRISLADRSWSVSDQSCFGDVQKFARQKIFDFLMNEKASLPTTALSIRRSEWGMSHP